VAKQWRKVEQNTQWPAPYNWMSWWSTERPDRSVANIIKAHAARVGLEPSQYSAIDPRCPSRARSQGRQGHLRGSPPNVRDFVPKDLTSLVDKKDGDAQISGELPR
jgi:hypothetical protein